MARITSVLNEDLYTFIMIYLLILLRMRTVLDKSCRQNQNTRFMFNKFSLKMAQLFEIMWKNRLDRDRPQVTKQ